MEVQQKAEIKVTQLLQEEVEKSLVLRELEQVRLKMERKRLDSFKKFLFLAGVHLCGTAPAVVMLVVAWIFGAWVGLNFLPSTVGCPNVHSSCYQWRLNKDTTIAPDKPVINQQVKPTKRKSKKQ